MSVPDERFISALKLEISGEGKAWRANTPYFYITYFELVRARLYLSYLQGIVTIPGTTKRTDQWMQMLQTLVDPPNGTESSISIQGDSHEVWLHDHLRARCLGFAYIL